MQVELEGRSEVMVNQQRDCDDTRSLCKSKSFPVI